MKQAWLRNNNQNLFWTLLLGTFALAMVLPFWVMLSGSLMTNSQLASPNMGVFPKAITFTHYIDAFSKVSLWQYLLNSIWVSFTASIIQLVISAMAAYGFARLQFKGKNILFVVVIMTMMIPPQVNLVPLFLLMKTLHLVDTFWALIIPGCVSAFGIFLLRQWFISLPVDLESAAILDGCSTWQYFWKVAFPLVLPAAVALGLYAFIANWNNFIWPLVIIQSDNLRTLPLGLAELKNTYRDAIDWGVMMAASSISIFPIIILYLFGQQYFKEALLQGSIKD